GNPAPGRTMMQAPFCASRMFRAVARLAVLASLSAASFAAGAQATDDGWPTRPVKVVIPYGAGSSPDVFARIVGGRLQQRRGQPVVVENRAGVGGNLGTGMVAKAPGDGYTFLVST